MKHHTHFKQHNFTINVLGMSNFVTINAYSFL